MFHRSLILINLVFKKLFISLVLCFFSSLWSFESIAYNSCDDLFNPQKKSSLLQKMKTDFGSDNLTLTEPGSIEDFQFDDTLPPYEGGVRRHYSHNGSLKSPLAILFLNFHSHSDFSSDLIKIRNKWKEINHPLGSSNSINFDYYLGHLLKDATASARFDAIRIISAKSKNFYYPFSDEGLRLSIYKKIWDSRMDPNLGITDSVGFTLAGIAIDNHDVVLLRFILSNPKFDLASSGLLKHLVLNDAFDSATITLSYTMDKVTGEEMADILTEVTFLTVLSNTRKWVANIFSDETWVQAISKINSENLGDDYRPRQKGFSIPLLQVALNQDFRSVNAILNSKLNFLKTIDDQYTASEVFILVDKLANKIGGLNKNISKYALLLEFLRKKFNNLEIELDYDSITNSGLGIYVNGEFLRVKDSKFNQILGPISVREILNFYCRDEIHFLPSQGDGFQRLPR